MTTTAVILTSGFVLIAVCGLLKWSFGAIAARRDYVIPDDYNMRFIQLRPPTEEELKGHD